MRSTENPEPRRTGLIWIWVGVVVMSAGALALFRLDGSVTRIVVGAALAVCLGMVAVMLWLDRRAEHETKRLAGRR
ncbi:MAG: hypothetical protein WD895_07765 [Acidimicrobiia bacterium]